MVILKKLTMQEIENLIKKVFQIEEFVYLKEKKEEKVCQNNLQINKQEIKLFK